MNPAPSRPLATTVPAAHIWLHLIANLLVGVTGLVYLVMKYALEPADPFDVVNHPLQPDVQHLHVLVAPLLVYAGGLFWSHAQLGIRTQRPRRRSGWTMVATFVPMVVSGYLLQIAAERDWQRIWGWIHAATSVLWLVGVVGHLSLVGLRRLRRGGVRSGARSAETPIL